MKSTSGWSEQRIPKGYTAKELNTTGGVPAWRYIGDLSHSAKRHYRGIPYRLDMRGNFEDGFHLELFYWWNNQWVHSGEQIISNTFPKVLNSIIDNLIGVKQRLIWS